MNKGLKILKWTVMGVIFILLFGWVTMLLWNWLVPDLFNGPVISFWQTLGLLLLAKILFGGMGKKWGSHNGAHWKHRYQEKLAGMTPEERERFKARVKDKWCSHGRESNGGNQDASNV